jgi:hypothetical protein
MVLPGVQAPPTGTTAPIGDALAEGVLVTVADAEDESDKNPLQKPWLQVLKAHCWSLVHSAWKLPHTV